MPTEITAADVRRQWMVHVVNHEFGGICYTGGTAASLSPEDLESEYDRALTMQWQRRHRR